MQALIYFGRLLKKSILVLNTLTVRETFSNLEEISRINLLGRYNF